ncbi:hypothetical protein GCM10023063_28440 [Arthrobacter methylotrophus]|uniref:Recombinase RecA n=1 Tax=Arthrobacter methylotrophus TaxID=121291 RepID=A0ABV5UQK0_9MICC
MNSSFAPLTESEYQPQDLVHRSVPVPLPPMSGTRNTIGVAYGDVAGLLSGDLPPAPKPNVLYRNDGNALFYRGQVNSLFGEPESGKTFVALAATAATLNGGGKAAILDLDHNGMQSIVSRLLDLGVAPETLSDLDKFRYKEPEDRADLLATIADLKAWRPCTVVVDSIGELLPMMNLNSNSPDDFTIAHAYILKPLAMSGACVISIDHVAKNPDSKAQGPTGTGAKARSTGGVMLRVTVKEQFTPGSGGSCYLNIKKDRHGGLRETSPTGDKEPLAGTFKMFPDSSFTVFAPEGGERTPAAAPAIDIAALKALVPPPVSVRDVKERLGWGTNRATLALKVLRDAFPVPETQGRGTGTEGVLRASTVPEEQGTLGLRGEGEAA